MCAMTRACSGKSLYTNISQHSKYTSLIQSAGAAKQIIDTELRLNTSNRHSLESIASETATLIKQAGACTSPVKTDCTWSRLPHRLSIQDQKKSINNRRRSRSAIESTEGRNG